MSEAMTGGAVGATAGGQPSSSPAAVTPSPVVGENAGKQEAGAPDATAQAAKAKEKPAAPKLYELKVNGKVQKFTEQELLARASMAEASQQRFNEAAQLRKQAESVISKIRDPKQVMAALQDPALGLSKDQIREAIEEWYSAEFIEPEKLTPEQKKLREYENKIKSYEEQEKQTAEAKRKAQEEAMTNDAREEMQKQIVDALENHGLPKSKFTIRRLAYWMQRNHSNGFDAPTEVLVSQVRDEIQSTIKDLVEASDGEVLVKLFGDGAITKLRKYDLEQLRKMREKPAQDAIITDDTTGEPKSDRPPTSAEVNARIRQLQKTGRF